jgi:uncharacterized protein YjbI with pentapeptide repeats
VENISKNKNRLYCCEMLWQVLRSASKWGRWLLICLGAILILNGCENVTEPSRQQQFEKCLRAAFDDLKSHNVNMRLAAISRIEALAAQSYGRDAGIKDELLAYVRNRQATIKVPGADLHGNGLKDFASGWKPLPADIQAALTLLTKPDLLGKRSQAHSIVLRGTNLSGVYLRKAHLEGAILSDALLMAADLAGANFKGADLRRAALQDANLEKACLQRASLWQVNFSNAMLRRADFRKAKLWAAFFQGAYLMDANFEAADMGSVNLSHANLEQANLRKSDLGRSSLQQTNLQNTDLTSAYLGRANMRGAFLTDAKLEDTNLIAADLTNAVGLTSKQLCSALTLYQATFDEALEEEVRQKCPHLLRKPK